MSSFKFLMFTVCAFSFLGVKMRTLYDIISATRWTFRVVRRRSQLTLLSTIVDPPLDGACSSCKALRT